LKFDNHHVHAKPDDHPVAGTTGDRLILSVAMTVIVGAHGHLTASRYPIGKYNHYTDTGNAKPTEALRKVHRNPCRLRFPHLPPWAHPCLAKARMLSHFVIAWSLVRRTSRNKAYGSLYKITYIPGVHTRIHSGVTKDSAHFSPCGFVMPTVVYASEPYMKDNVKMIEKNRRWVGSLHTAINQLSGKDRLMVMREAGVGCSFDILALCESVLNHPVCSLEDLITGWNTVRKSKNLQGQWVMHGGCITGTFHECGCPLVRSGFVQLTPVQCLCSKGMMEKIFSHVTQKKADVHVKQSIGNGDDVCEFTVMIQDD